MHQDSGRDTAPSKHPDGPRCRAHVASVSQTVPRPQAVGPSQRLWSQAVGQDAGPPRSSALPSGHSSSRAQPGWCGANPTETEWEPSSFAVTKSRCPSYVGITGILLQETKHVFKVITKEDRLKGACLWALWAPTSWARGPGLHRAVRPRGSAPPRAAQPNRTGRSPAPPLGSRSCAPAEGPWVPGGPVPRASAAHRSRKFKTTLGVWFL